MDEVVPQLLPGVLSCFILVSVAARYALLQGSEALVAGRMDGLKVGSDASLLLLRCVLCNWRGRGLSEVLGALPLPEAMLSVLGELGQAALS